MSKQSESKDSNRLRSSDRLYILPLLLFFCTLLYYFGELVDFTGWDFLRFRFFYIIHDVHRLFFLAPIIYAGHTARIRVAIIVTLVSFIIFLPRAFYVSPYPDPLLRAVLFTIIAGAMGVLTGFARNRSDQVNYLEGLLLSEKEALLEALRRVADGVIITGPDYKIRFANASMVKDFGEAFGTCCYSYLHKRDSPCEQICKLRDVIDGATEKWQYSFPDGRTYEILSAPYVDSDGAVCQLSLFRKLAQGREAGRT